jgi:tRNA modification GTPase
VPVVFAGVPVTLVDTAGLRDSSDPVEAEGVARARARARTADLVLHCAPDPSEGGWLGQPVLTMADRTGRPPGEADGLLIVSALTGEGMDALRAWLGRWAAGFAGAGEPALVTRARQREAILASRAALGEAASESDPVLRAEALRRAAHALAVLAGRADVEAVLDLLFARFCIGK